MHVFADPSEKLAKYMHKQFEDSYVGMGAKTVMDKHVRSSKETKEFNITEEFDKFLTRKVQEGLTEMNAGELLVFSPHKIIVYGPGDFFAEHTDSCHTPGQNMSCVVELATEWETEDEDGGLTVNGNVMTDGHDSNKPSLCLFYHDLPHYVPRIEMGYRISITFDLVVEPPNFEINFKEDLEAMKAIGVKRFGFFTQHRYLGDQALKGIDDKLVKGITPFVKNIKRVELASYENGWVHKDLNNLMTGTAKEILNVRCSDEDEDESDDEDEKNYHSPVPFPKKFEMNYDKDGKFKIVKDEYRYGDVFVAWTEWEEYQTHSQNDDIHLGNEGFYGEIHENTFVLCEI
jgi:hypothetical protein